MPVIQDKVEFVEGVGVMVDADQGIIDDMFPVSRYHTKKKIRFDMAKVEGVVSEYNSFANTANVTEKDGKDVVELEAVNLNNSISKEVADADMVEFGQSETGEGSANMEMESALNGVGKIRRDHLATKKAIAYEVLTTFRIKDGFEDRTGKHDIVFPIPAANKVIFDGTTAGQLYWSNAASKPLDNIYEAWLAMEIRPTRVIMNHVTYSHFYNNAQVNTIDNTTTGVKKNFKENDGVANDSYYYTAGTIMYKGMTIDVKVETQLKSNNQPYMPTGYVVLGSPIGEVHHAGIPVAKPDGIEREAKEWDVFEVIAHNPPQHEYVVRTGATPVLKNGYAYYSIKVEA